MNVYETPMLLDLEEVSAAEEASCGTGGTIVLEDKELAE